MQRYPEAGAFQATRAAFELASTQLAGSKVPDVQAMPFTSAHPTRSDVRVDRGGGGI